MAKAYLTGEEKDPDPKKNRKAYYFDSQVGVPGKYWTTSESAQRACEVLDTLQISIPYPDGRGSHICGAFQVEKLSEERFVVFSEVPDDLQIRKDEQAKGAAES
jgi:hypothetical protein